MINVPIDAIKFIRLQVQFLQKKAAILQATFNPKNQIKA